MAEEVEYYPSLKAKLFIKPPIKAFVHRDKVQVNIDGVTQELNLTRIGEEYSSDYFTIQRFGRQVKALSKGLALEYLIYEGNGTTLHDTSGNGLDGTISGCDWGQLPNGKPYLTFNALDQDYVYVGDLSPIKITGPITIEQLFYVFKEPEGERSLVRKWQPGKYSYMTRVHTAYNSFEFFLSPNNKDIYAVRTYAPTDKWFHAVVVYDGQYMKIYVRGELAETKAYNLGIADTTAPLVIGARSDLQAYFFHGHIALIRIWSRALSDEEIKQLYELAKLMVPELE